MIKISKPLGALRRCLHWLVLRLSWRWCHCHFGQDECVTVFARSRRIAANKCLQITGQRPWGIEDELESKLSKQNDKLSHEEGGKEQR